jgi:hypothetical protein
MTKLKSAPPKLKSSGGKADYQWEPKQDQIYGPNDPPTLFGDPGSFNKVTPYSFTMDAPGRTLTLQPTIDPTASFSAWGQAFENELNPTNRPCVFDIKNGTFVYD